MDEFNEYRTLKTGSVVGVMNDPSPRRHGIMLHFINPLLEPNDAPGSLTFDNAAGKNTTLRMSDEAAVCLMLLLQERYGSGKEANP